MHCMPNTAPPPCVCPRCSHLGDPGSVRELERTAGLRPHTLGLLAEATTLRPDDMQAALENSTTN